MLEVIAVDVDDALRAEEGGADQLELVATMNKDGLSPSPQLVAQVVQAVGIPVRPMVRLRGGFGTDVGEIAVLKSLVNQYLSNGAAGVVLGYLTPSGDVDAATLEKVLGSDFPNFTFHRAIDHANPGAWEAVLSLPNPPTYVLTAGSPKGVSDGIEVLLERATVNAGKILVGGGLKESFVPQLREAGIQNFHIGSAARHNNNFENPIDPAAVAHWIELTRG